MSKKPELIMTVGLPRSGKSTFIKNNFIWNTPVVNPDSIRVALHGEAYVKSAEKFVWAISRTMVESLFLAGHHRVILDATNGFLFSRESWKDGRWTRNFLVFDTPVDVCKSRCIISKRGDLIPVIEQMYERWEPPTQSELEEEYGVISYVEPKKG